MKSKELALHNVEPNPTDFIYEGYFEVLSDLPPDGNEGEDLMHQILGLKLPIRSMAWVEYDRVMQYREGIQGAEAVTFKGVVGIKISDLVETLSSAGREEAAKHFQSHYPEEDDGINYFYRFLLLPIECGQIIVASRN